MVMVAELGIPKVKDGVDFMSIWTMGFSEDIYLTVRKRLHTAICIFAEHDFLQILYSYPQH